MAGSRPPARYRSDGGRSWPERDVILIRPSGTEALIRVMVEAKTTEVARKVAEDLADLIKILSEKIQF